MEAIISQLWDTGIEIVTTSADCNEIQDVSDLRKCKNVLVGTYDEDMRAWEIMLDNSLLMVHFRTVTHPTGCGKLTICEIY